MRKLLAVLAAVTMVSAGCFLGPCPMVDCAADVRLEVKDAAGNALTDFTGVVVVGNVRYPVACGASADAGAASDGGSAGTGTADAGVLPDGGVARDGSPELVLCDPGMLSLYGGGVNHDVYVELSSGSRAYKGMVDVKYVNHPIGPAHCNTACTSGTGRIVLQ